MDSLLINLNDVPPDAPLLPLSHPADMQWGTAIGAWGDVLCGLSGFLARVKKGGILHYGYDPQIVRFLSAQPFCTKAVQITPASQSDYAQTVSLACSTPAPVSEWLPRILTKSDIPLERVVSTHVDYQAVTSSTFSRWTGARLPVEAYQWAADIRGRYTGDCLLLHPYSTQSVTIDGHWPIWGEAVRWLLQDTPYTFLLTGSGWGNRLYGSHPRLINLIDKAPSMSAVFALAQLCEGVLTTSNSLSVWAAIQRLQTICCCNGLMSLPHNYFRQWINVPTTQLIEQTQSVVDFQQAFSKTFL